MLKAHECFLVFLLNVLCTNFSKNHSRFHVIVVCRPFIWRSNRIERHTKPDGYTNLCHLDHFFTIKK